jgi:hypothetical protein
MYGLGLRDLTGIAQPEGRSLTLHYLPDVGQPVPLTLAVYHQLVASLAIDAPVDTIVHPHFDVARNLLLYTWFESSFMHPSELQAFGSLELALRLKLGGWRNLQRGPGLARLLREAVERGLFSDDLMGPYPRVTGFGEAWSREHGVGAAEANAHSAQEVRHCVDVICDAIPGVRNRLAHGHPGWVGTAFATLSTCRDLLNCLVPFCPGDEA